MRKILMNFGQSGVVPVAAQYNAPHVAQVNQVHGNNVHVIRTPSDSLLRPNADAMVTTLPHTPLTIRSADCAPILLHNADGSVIAAVHSGRSGTFLNIVAQTVAAMRALNNTSPLYAFIGPCIAQPQYPVGEAVAAAAPAPMQPFFNAQHCFNLPAAVQWQLEQLNVVTCLQQHCCTFLNPAYASFRRGDAVVRNWSTIAMGE